ncbi:hypothetical protein M409DRAFT_23379 [Zasmidium cellare ATCC 36951]|uniref:Uncharacterized protein n=1 Tax=Zasmidium cellare ATCC 36951 TaxID=1080233 RepID=A0A6A6CJ13_ZASCE|nr:uncharacterized protein M409DRAFT_23379 [Zasmidium cellare ATCC 36951]KAF2166190.1 hypothetical protein M409DRAFT_23379 [Zasmidium cellare ATCC 36951]
MGNTLTTSTPAFLLHSHHSQTQPQQQQSPPQETTNKPPKTNPYAVKEPAFQGYVAGWRQGSFDSDAQEFSFATFQTSHVSVNRNETGMTEGYEGDDDEDSQLDRDGNVNGGLECRVQRSEFERLGRGRGFERAGSVRERERERDVLGDVGEGKMWKERKFEEPSLERKLERVRRTVEEEHALPGRGLGLEVERVG